MLCYENCVKGFEKTFKFICKSKGDFGTLNELFVYFLRAVAFLDDMMSGTKDLHWDRIKVVCSQPYLKFNKQYGLQFIAVKTIVPKKESKGTGPLVDVNQNKLNHFFNEIR